jgi:predicted nucleic acid-binding protein
MPPVYVDTNVFIYAFLKTKRQLQPSEIKMKESAKKIVARINAGENVATSVVHFSEVCNILEDFLPFEEAILMEKALLHLENIVIFEITSQDYLNAVSLAEDFHVGVNDALAFMLMEKEGIQKIYTFDKDFDYIQGIKCIIE